LGLAVHNARDKAEAIARAAGVELAGLRSVDACGEGPVVFREYGEMRAEGAAGTPVIPGRIEVRMKVRASYEF